MPRVNRLAVLRRYDVDADGVRAAVSHKRVRHLTIAVHRDGRVRVTAPARASTRDVERALRERIDWIRSTQLRLAAIERPPALTYVTGEIHRFRGKEVRLAVIESAGRTGAALRDDSVLILTVHPGASLEDRRLVLERWFRHELATLLPDLFATWSARMQVYPRQWRIRRMRTRWGSCNTRAGRIWLNVELVTVSDECLEYVLVHELAHLIEASHNHRFRGVMDRYMPDWRARRRELHRSTPDQQRSEG